MYNIRYISTQYLYIFVYFRSRLTALEQMFWRLCSSQPDKLAPRCPVSIVMYLYLRPICLRYLFLRRVCLCYLYLHHVCLAKQKCSKPHIKAGDRFKKGAVLRGRTKFLSALQILFAVFIASTSSLSNLSIALRQKKNSRTGWCRSRCSHCALCFVCLALDLQDSGAISATKHPHLGGDGT